MFLLDVKVEVFNLILIGFLCSDVYIRAYITSLFHNKNPLQEIDRFMFIAYIKKNKSLILSCLKIS